MQFAASKPKNIAKNGGANGVDARASFPWVFACGVPVISVAARVHLEATIALGSVSVGEGASVKDRNRTRFCGSYSATHVGAVSSVLSGGNSFQVTNCDPNNASPLSV